MSPLLEAHLKNVTPTETQFRESLLRPSLLSKETKRQSDRKTKRHRKRNRETETKRGNVKMKKEKNEGTTR